jgi:hypothetical protein
MNRVELTRAPVGPQDVASRPAAGIFAPTELSGFQAAPGPFEEPIPCPRKKGFGDAAESRAGVPPCGAKDNLYNNFLLAVRYCRSLPVVGMTNSLW